MSGASEQRSEKNEEVLEQMDADTNDFTKIEAAIITTTVPGAPPSTLICYLNSNIRPKGKGVEYFVNVNDKLDMNRLVITSAHSSVRVTEVDILIPESKANGEINTIEGILSRVRTGLRQDQARRKEEHQAVYRQIEEYLKKLDKCLELKVKFTMTLRDISGNCFIANRPGCMNISEDPSLRSKKFTRTKEEDQFLGIQDCPAVQEEPEENEEEDDAGKTDFKDEVLEMATTCSECRAPCLTKMKVTDIPLFKEVIILATDCDNCGSRTNEVKSGRGIKPKGKKVILKVKSKADFSRYILKSSTAQFHVGSPKFGFYLGLAPKDERYVTIENLLLDIKEKLSNENSLIAGVSEKSSLKSEMEKYCHDFDRLLTGDHEFTIVLDDPAGNCYIQNVFAPEEDPEMTTIEYERTFEQNEELGLNDMNVGDDHASAS